MAEADYPGLVSLLRFFAESGRVNVLDRLGFAQSPVAVREAIYEALRTARVLSANAVRVRVKVQKYREGRPVEEEVETVCADYNVGDSRDDVAECMAIIGRVTWSEAPSRIPPGKWVCCTPPPRIPGEDELKRFFSILEEDPVKGLVLAKELASLAFAKRSR